MTKTKSIRLSATKRQEIVESILKHWNTNNPRKCNKELENTIAEYYYNKAFKNIITELANPKLKDFFTYSDNVKVQEKGIVNRYYFLEEKPYPTGHSYFDSPVVFVSDTEHELQTEIDANIVFNNDLSNKRDKFERELFQTVNSVNTTGQLEAIWPEVMQYLPLYMTDPSTGINLPTIAIANLNDALGTTSA